MKNLLLLIAISFAYVTLLSANNDPILVTIRHSGAQTIDVQLANLEQKRTGIAIQDVKGGNWFSEYAWNENGYHKKINMAGMPPGEYLVVIKKQNTIHTQAFMLTSKYLIFFETKKKKIEDKTVAKLVSLDNSNGKRGILANVTETSNNTLKVQLANLQGKQVVIDLHKIGEASAMEDKVSGEQGYSKNLNLTGMPFGNYYLHLQTPEESFLYFFDFGRAGVMIKSKQYLANSTISVNEKLATK